MLFSSIAGVLVMIFGLHFLGIFRIGFLDREARMDAGDQGGSPLGPMCWALPLPLAGRPASARSWARSCRWPRARHRSRAARCCWRVYAIGLGVPFLLVATFLPRSTGVMGWMKRHMEPIERVMGLLLWTIGLLMLTGGFSAFSFWLLETFPALALLG